MQVSSVEVLSPGALFGTMRQSANGAGKVQLHFDLSAQILRFKPVCGSPLSGRSYHCYRWEQRPVREDLPGSLLCVHNRETVKLTCMLLYVAVASRSTSGAARHQNQYRMPWRPNFPHTLAVR